MFSKSIEEKRRTVCPTQRQPKICESDFKDILGALPGLSRSTEAAAKTKENSKESKALMSEFEDFKERVELLEDKYHLKR